MNFKTLMTVVITLIIAVLVLAAIGGSAYGIYLLMRPPNAPRCGKNGYKYLRTVNGKEEEDCCAVMPTVYDKNKKMYTSCPLPYNLPNLPEGGCAAMGYTTYDNGTWGCCGNEPTEFAMIGRNCPN